MVATFFTEDGCRHRDPVGRDQRSLRDGFVPSSPRAERSEALGGTGRAARPREGAPGDRQRKAGEEEVKTETKSCAGKSSRACKANPCAVGGDPGSEA